MTFAKGSAVTQPREILPGSTYLITRRVLRRHFLLRPDKPLTQLVVYALAVSAERYGIQVHAVCAMSTHLHLVVTDVDGVLPQFLQYFHRLVAHGTKRLRQWEGPLWDLRATSAVRLLTRAAIVEKIAYVLANPVAAGLVEHAQDWPGATVDVRDLGRGTLRAARPSVYFDPDNSQWPAEKVLPIKLPPGTDKSKAKEFRRDVRDELKRLEELARAEAKRQGLRFLGAKGAQEISPYERAKSAEAVRDRNPTFAVGRQAGDALRDAVAAVRTFRASYRAALEQWKADVRNALFPAGTWWMRVFHAARAEGALPAT
jgi:REP element-mobilizing transposase RayT